MFSTSHNDSPYSRIFLSGVKGQFGNYKALHFYDLNQFLESPPGVQGHDPWSHDHQGK